MPHITLHATQAHGRVESIAPFILNLDTSGRLMSWLLYPWGMKTWYFHSWIRWFTAMYSKEKPSTGPMIIEKNQVLV